MTSDMVAPCLSSHRLSPSAFPPVPTASVDARSSPRSVYAMTGGLSMLGGRSSSAAGVFSVVGSLQSSANDTT